MLKQLSNKIFINLGTNFFEIAHMESKTEIKERFHNLFVNKKTDCANTVYMNPVAQYTDLDRFNQEKEEIFKNQPICIGISSLIPNVGDWFTVEVVGYPILLVRDKENKINAYLNICSHRGAKLAEGKGNTVKAFKCPYHSWTYSLNGELLSRPRENLFNEIPKNKCNLKSIELREQYGLLWILLSKKAVKESNKYFKELDVLIDHYDFNSLYHYKTGIMQPNINWKLGVDTFLELYHVAHLHPETLSDILKGDTCLFDKYGRHMRIIGPRKSLVESKANILQIENIERHIINLKIIFPNTILVDHEEHIELWHVLPEDSVNKCRVSISLFTKVPYKTDSEIRHWENNFQLLKDVVEEEDFPLGEGVQKGFYADKKRNIIFGKNEPGLQHFHKNIDKFLSD